MPTAEQTITFDGSEALVTNVSQHTSEDDRSFRVFKDLVSDRTNRIIKRDGIGASLGSPIAQVLHNFTHIDTTTGSPEQFVLAWDGSDVLLWNGVTTWTAQTLPITPSAGSNGFFCNAENRVFFCDGRDALLYATRTGAATLTWRSAGVDAPSSAPTYSLATTNPPVTDVTTTRTLTTVQGDATVTASGAAFVLGASWVGKRMTINGVHYEILSVTSTTVLELTEGFKETGAAGLAWSVYPGVGNWDDISPKYQFSYYNPTTGHASNPSPILEVTEEDQVGRTITVTIAGAAENTTAYNNGYTQIQLFRTAKNSALPVALNEKLTNNNTASAITYVETAVKFADTFLTDIEAPTKNRKPPSGLSSLAFHQGRMWGTRPADGRVYFTPIAAEIDLGAAVECWPALYTRSIQEPQGLVVTGGGSSADSLVIQTANGDFSVDGYDSVTFSPYKLKTRRSGSRLHAATDVDGSLVQFYSDKRIISFPEGIDLGAPIQDKLDLCRDSIIGFTRIHWFASKSRNLLFFSFPSTAASTTNDYTYIFDLDRGGAIYEWNVGFRSFATVHNSTTGALELFACRGSDGIAVKLLTTSNQDAAANFAPTFKTGLIRFPEQMAIIKYVKLYVNDVSGTWTGRIFLNEQTNTGATDGTVTALTFRATDYKEQSAQGKELIATAFATPSKRNRAKVFQLEVTFPTADLDLYVEKVVIGFDHGQDPEAQS